MTIVENNHIKKLALYIRLTLSLTIGSFVTVQLMSQSLQIINHFSIESGLPSNYVYDVIQDHQGYLWIMTNAGLCKHNGSELEFIQIPNHLFDLKGAIELFEYNKDQLWIIRYTDILPNGEPQNSNSDLIIYDKKLKQFSKIEDNSISIPFCVNTISHITPFENSFLITTIDGKLYEMKDKQFKLLFQKEGEKFSYATKIADDQYWLRTPSELFQLIDDELQLKNQVNSSYFSAITSSKDSIYFAKASFSSKNITQFSYPNHTTNRIKSKDLLSSITYINNTLYYTTNNTIFYFDKQQKITLDLREALETTAFTIKGIKPLADGKLVAYGINGGLVILKLQQQYFDRFSSPKTLLSMRGMLPLSDSVLLINSYAGQLLVNTKNKESQLIKNTLFPNGKKTTLFGYDLAMSKNGKIWSTADHYTIKHQDTSSIDQIDCIYEISHPDQFVCRTRKVYIHPITDSIFIGTTHGLFYYNESLDSFLLYTKGLFADQLAKTTIHNIRAFGDSLWICTDVGLFLKTSQKGIFKYFPVQSYQINDLYIDEQGRFWLASLKNGVLLWDIEQDQITKFDVANGLSNSNTTCIYPDALGNLWIPTFYGLNYLNTKQFTIQSFFEDSGLTHNEFNNASHLLTSDSLLYLGGLNGVTIVDLRQGAYDFTSKNKIPLVANRLELYNKKTEKIADIEISDYSVIKIPSNAKGLILDFDFLDFTEEESHDFLYKIENLEDTWIAKKNHQLELVVPPAGEYIIRMKVKSKDGRWSSNEIAIPILVKKPIYFKAWFILLLALSLGGISYGFIQFLLYQNRKENKRLEKEVQRRTQEIEEDKRIIAQQLQKIQEVQESKEKVFSIIGHDLRSPLLGLKNLTQKIDYLIKHNRWSDLSILTQRFDKNIDTLQALLDKLLVWTQLEQGEYQISPDWVCLVEIIEETITLYEPLIQKKEIQLSVEILPKSELFVDYRSLATILRNLIDNAIKHTPEKGIIKIYADHSLISIKNQGEKMSGRLISFLEASNGKVKYPDTGLGLQICRELVLLNKGEIKVKNEQAYSNTIYVKFTYQ